MMFIEVIHLANRIRALREEAGMTQIRLSTELEVSQETISAYETGRHNPSYSALVQMAQIFHASIDYIMGLSDVRKPPSSEPMPQEQQAALELFSSLDAMNQALALAYMQGLSDAAQNKKPFLKL